MNIRTIGIVSPGDMGQAIAARLKEAGFNVCTALDGRSGRTAELAAKAGLRDCGTVERLVAECDLILSILNPAAALQKAREVAAGMRAAGKPVAFADCNAIAPKTVQDIETIIRGAGGAFVDAGIIGPPPRGPGATRIYVSGPDAGLFSQIRHASLDIRVAGERAGDASAVKMCYAAFTKGTIALGMELLIAAERLGVADLLARELKESQAAMHASLLARSVSMPPKAYRWVPEMLEIAKTFEDAGMTPRMLQGAADMYEMIAATPLGRESPEDARTRGRTGEDIVQLIAAGKS